MNPITPERVAEALTRECGMCEAPPGQECVSTIDGEPLRTKARKQPVHTYRLEPK